jgi:hypothetical protein
MDTPVLLIVFNRPDTTALMLKALESVRPSRLFIAADAPRPDRPDESARCAATRALVSRIPWPCSVETLFADENQGCREGPIAAITWFLSRNESGIILEDDCIPHPAFFPFCAELLQRYRNDERVMTIGGANFQGGQKRSPYSYFFSQLIHIWGWATWARAWKHFDANMTTWSETRSLGLMHQLFPGERARRHWDGKMRGMAAGRRDAWDYAWMYACYSQRGLCILPESNLITNIGGESGSTHQSVAGDAFINVPHEALDFPLRHPPYMVVNRAAELHTQNLLRPPRWRRLLRRYLAR